MSCAVRWLAYHLGLPFFFFFFLGGGGGGEYLHVKIVSLANVKSCVTVGPISLMANVWPCIVPVDYLSGLAL